MLKALLDPSYVIGRGYAISTLTACLSFAINNEVGPYFGHVKPVPGMEHSIRLLGKEAFEGSVPLPEPLSSRELALHLMKLSEGRQLEDQARYSNRPTCSALKGWTISRSVDETDDGGNPLIAAYATWIEP